MFVVTVIFTVADEHAEFFLVEVLRNAAQSRTQEAGCIRFDVCRADDLPTEVFLYEIYADEAAFEAHKTTPHYAEFSAAVGPVVTGKIVRTYALMNGVKDALE